MPIDDPLVLPLSQRKPASFCADPYQTYDLFLADNIHRVISDRLGATKQLAFALGAKGRRFQIPGLDIETGSSGLILIERFTPWSIPWCEGYSTKLFNWVLPLTVTGLYDSPFFNGNGLDPSTDYGSKSPTPFPPVLDEGVPPIIEYENLGAEPVWFTWLQEFSGDISGGYLINEIVGNGIALHPKGRIFNKAYWKVDPGIKVILDLGAALWTSVVVSSRDTTALAVATDAVPFYLRWANFDSIWEARKLHLLSFFPQWNKYLARIQYEVRSNFSLWQGEPQNDPYAPNLVSPSHASLNYDYSPGGWYDLRLIPFWYQFAALEYAANDFTQSGELRGEDLGQGIDLKLKESGIHYAIWKLDLEKERSFEIFEGGEWIPNPLANFALTPTFSDLEAWRGYLVDPLLGISNPTYSDSFDFPGVGSSGVGRLVDDFIKGSPFSLQGWPLGGIPRHSHGTDFEITFSYNWDLFGNGTTKAIGWVFNPFCISDLTAFDRSDPFLIQKEAGHPIYWADFAMMSEGGVTSWNVAEEEDPDNPGKFEQTGIGTYRSSGFASLKNLSIDWDRSLVTASNIRESIITRIIPDYEFSIASYQLAEIGAPSYFESPMGDFTDWQGLIPIPGIYSDSTFTSNGVSHAEFQFYRLDFITFQPWEGAPVFAPSYIKEEITEAAWHLFNPDNSPVEVTNMADSIRLKEIHQAIDAQKYAWVDDSNITPRFANLGYYIERLARVMGISVNEDGSIRSIRQSKHIPKGVDIPKGWNIGQWGRNDGGDKEGQSGGRTNEERDGLAYEVRSNRFILDKYSGEPSKIEEGGYVLVENWPQLLHILMDDLDKALGMQYAGANALPSADKSQVLTYEGLHTLLTEVAYMLSAVSEQTSQSLVSSNINQAVLLEVLGAFGFPVATKEFEVFYGDSDNIGKVPFPGLDNDSPTLMSLVTWLMLNISRIGGGSLGVTPPPLGDNPDEPT